MSFVSASVITASQKEYAAVLLRRCFIVAQKYASELLRMSFQELVSASPSTFGDDWFELFKSSVDESSRKFVESKPEGPWDVFSIYDSLLSRLPDISSQLGWKDRDLVRTKSLALDFECVLNTRNWWAHKPVSVEMVCSAVAALQDSLNSICFFLGTTFDGAALCETKLQETLMNLRAHGTIVQLDIDEIAHVMLTRAFQMLCEGSREVVVNCRRSTVDTNHLKSCYSCREQVCKCTGLTPNHVKHGTKDAQVAVEKHCTAGAEACMPCSERIQKCVHDVASLMKHFQRCQNVSCNVGGLDNEIDVIVTTRNCLFHGSSSNVVLLALAALICVTKVMEARKKLDKTNPFWKESIIIVQKNCEILQEHLKFPDAEELIRSAAAAIRKNKGTSKHCEWIPSKQTAGEQKFDLSDFEVVLHILYGIVPVPTTHTSCDCKVLGVWSGGGKKAIDTVLVDILVRDTRFISSTAHKEVSAIELPKNDDSVIEVSRKLCHHFKADSAAAAEKAAKKASGAAGGGSGDAVVGSSSSSGISHGECDKYEQFFVAFQKLTGNSDDWKEVANNADRIASLLRESGNRFSDMLGSQVPLITCTIAEKMREKIHSEDRCQWLLLQHLLFKHVKSGYLQETKQKCPCRETLESNSNNLSPFISIRLKDLQSCKSESEFLGIVAKNSAFIALLVEIHCKESLVHKPPKMSVKLSDEVPKDSKFLPLKSDIYLVGRQKLIDRCCSQIQQALRIPTASSGSDPAIVPLLPSTPPATPTDDTFVSSPILSPTSTISNVIFMQLLLGISGAGKTSVAVEAVHKFQRFLLEHTDSCVVWVQLMNCHSADEVDLDYWKFGLALSRQLRLVDGMSHLEIKERLTSHLRNARYLVFADDVTDKGLNRLLEILPVSSAGCAVIGTSRSLKESELCALTEKLRKTVNLKYKRLNCFNEEEVKECLIRCGVPQKVCDDLTIFKLLENFKYNPHNSSTFPVSATVEHDHYLPLAVRLFANWLSNRSKSMDISEPEDFKTFVATVVRAWNSEREQVMDRSVPEYILSLKGTVRLALNDLLDSGMYINSAKQLLAIVTICNDGVPSSLFDDWPLLKTEIPNLEVDENDSRLSTLLNHLQSCTGLLQVFQVDDTNHRHLNMHLLVREVLSAQILREQCTLSPWFFDRTQILDLLEHHLHAKNFVFLKRIASSCDSILNHECVKILETNPDFMFRALKLNIQLRKVFVQMRSSSYCEDIATIYNLQNRIYEHGEARVCHKEERKPLIIKGVGAVSSLVSDSTYLGYHLVDSDQEQNVFWLRGLSLGPNIHPDSFISSDVSHSRWADESLWHLLEEICQELHANSCRYRIVCRQFSTPLDVFMYSSDTLLDLKNRVAVYGIFSNHEKIPDVSFFHNGRLIVGEEHSISGLGIPNDGLILLSKHTETQEILREIDFIQASQKLQHAFALFNSAVKRRKVLSDAAIKFIGSMPKSAVACKALNSHEMSIVYDPNKFYRQLSKDANLLSLTDSAISFTCRILSPKTVESCSSQFQIDAATHTVVIASEIAGIRADRPSLWFVKMVGEKQVVQKHGLFIKKSCKLCFCGSPLPSGVTADTWYEVALLGVSNSYFELFETSVGGVYAHFGDEPVMLGESPLTRLDRILTSLCNKNVKEQFDTIWFQEPPSVTDPLHKDIHDMRHKILSGQWGFSDRTRNPMSSKMSKQRILRIYLSACHSEFELEREFVCKVFVPYLQHSCNSQGFQCIFVDTHQIVAKHETRAIFKERERFHDESAATVYISFVGSVPEYKLPDSIPCKDFLDFRSKIHENRDFDLDVIDTWYLQDLNAVDPCYVLQPGIHDPSQQKVKEHILSLLEQHLYPYCHMLSRELSFLSEQPHVQSIFILKSPAGNHEAVDTFLSRHKLESYCNQIQCIKHFGDDLEYLKSLSSVCCEPILGSLKAICSDMSHFSDLETECLFHLNFAYERVKSFCEIDKVDLILDGIEKFMAERRKEMCVLLGPSGSGKTWLMAKAIEKIVLAASVSADNIDDDSLSVGSASSLSPLIIVRFIGASPRTSKVETLLYDICSQLQHQLGEPGTIFSTDKDIIRNCFLELLRKVGRKRRIFLILDNIDFFSEHDFVQIFWWLPLPHEWSDANTTILISCMALDSELPDSLNSLTLHKICDCFSVTAPDPMSLLHIIKIPSIISDWSEMFDHILLTKSARRRQITSKKQRQAIQNFVENNTLESSQNPLFLTIVAQIALLWHSFVKYDPVPVLPKPRLLQELHAEFEYGNKCDVKDMIEFEFCRLEHKFGFEVTSAALSFISLAVDGISELELCEVLCLDDDVLAEIQTRFECTPIFRGIPVNLISMFLDSIKAFLTHRGIHNRELLSWYHRQFLLACKSRYCSNDRHVSKRHIQLSHFFIGKYAKAQQPPESWNLWLQERYKFMENQGVKLDRCTRPQPFCFDFPDGGPSFFQYRGNGRSLNRRRCIEAVHHLIQGGLYDEAVSELCSFDGISARIQCGEQFSMFQQFSHLEVKLMHEQKQEQCVRLQHFRRWLISHADFIFQKPRLHTLISCSLQPSRSIARIEMLSWFDHEVFKEFGHYNNGYVANVLLCCPFLHVFGGKSLKLRFNRKSLTSISISERYSAIIILKKVKERRFHCVEIRDNLYSSIVDRFPLDDKTFSEVSPCWNSSGTLLAIACFHHDDSQSMVFMWYSPSYRDLHANRDLQQSKTKSFDCLSIPGLACLSWGKQHAHIDYRLAVVFSSSHLSPLTESHRINIYDLSCSNFASQPQPLCVAFNSNPTLPDGKSDSIQRITQLELLELITDPKATVVHVAFLGSVRKRSDHVLFFECTWRGFQQPDLTCIVIDSSICPLKGGAIIRISNVIPQKIAVACSHGTAIYPILSSKIVTRGMQPLNFHESIDSAHFMTIDFDLDQRTLFILTISHFPNDPACLKIWRASSTCEFQLVCSVRLHANFFSNCFSCGGNMYATPTEESDASYVTFWKLDEVLNHYSRSSWQASISSSERMESNSFSRSSWDHGTVRLLCWKDDSSVVASIGVASSPSSFDVVDFWTWSSNQNAMDSPDHPSIIHTLRMSFRCFEHVKSVHWIPLCLANGPGGIKQKFAVLVFDERLQLVIYDVSKISEPKRLGSTLVWDQDIKSSCLSSCYQFLALAGSQSVRLLRYNQKNETFFSEKSFCDFPFHRKAIIQVDRCAQGQTPSFIILMRDVKTRCLELVKILKLDDRRWAQSLFFRYQDEEGSLPSYFSLFRLKSSPDGRICAISCSSEGNQPSKVVVLDFLTDVASKMIMDENVNHCVSDLSWSLSSDGLKYILATGDPNVSSDELSPCSFIFKKRSRFSAVYHFEKSQLWDPEQMIPRISTGKLAFSPNSKILASASTSEVINYFAVSSFLEQSTLSAE